MYIASNPITVELLFNNDDQAMMILFQELSIVNICDITVPTFPFCAWNGPIY